MSVPVEVGLRLVEKFLETHEKLPIFVSICGSHLLGTETDESDVDVRGVFIEKNFEDYLLQTISDCHTVEEGKNELVLWGFHHYYKILKKGDTNAVEFLFSFTYPECVLYKSEVWDLIVGAGRKLISRPLRGFLGFALALSQRYDIKALTYRALLFVDEKIRGLSDDTRVEDIVDQILKDLPEDIGKIVGLVEGKDGRTYLAVGKHLYLLQSHVGDMKRSLKTQIEKRGERVLRLAHRGNDMDWKAVSHAVRALYEGIELHRTGQLSFPLKERKTILEIKLGKWTHSDVRELLQKLLDEFDELECGRGSVLPDEPEDNFRQVASEISRVFFFRRDG